MKDIKLKEEELKLTCYSLNQEIKKSNPFLKHKDIHVFNTSFLPLKNSNNFLIASRGWYGNIRSWDGRNFIILSILNSDLKKIKQNILELPSNWHKNISYVPQNISLINDSLEKNIALTINEKEINKNKILQSIKLSCLTDFFNSSNQEQNLGERGVQVSGGERQRIGIARALYYDRNIYIFDEATNALDENTESKILENLKFYLKNKIVIIISHKKTTLKFCDKIYNFINGELN